MRLGPRVALLLVAGLLVSGCAAGAPQDEQTIPASTPQEAAEIVASCLEEAGWEARVDPDDSVNVEVPKGQETQYEAASEECWGKVSTPSFDEVSEADRRGYYSKFVDLRQCIVDMGIEMPPPPTYQSWVEMEGAWSPYVDIPQAETQQRWSELEAACPQIAF